MNPWEDEDDRLRPQRTGPMQGLRLHRPYATRGSWRVGAGDSPARVQAAQRKFAILRVAKLKTMGALRGSLQHTFRERDTPNADLNRIPDNQILVGTDTAAGVAAAWKAKAPDKIRKNGVLAVEYLVTASPEALQVMSRDEQDAYFAGALEWLEDRHGADRILSAVIHRDETTPHLSALVIPLDVRGKLNARSYLGGRDKLREMQTGFARDVAAEFGIERGIEGSRARHRTIRSFYAALREQPGDRVRLPEREAGGLLGRGAENDTEWRQRAEESASAQLHTARLAAMHQAQDARLAQSEARSLRQSVSALSESVCAAEDRSMHLEKEQILLQEIATAARALIGSDRLAREVLEQRRQTSAQSEVHGNEENQETGSLTPDLKRHRSRSGPEDGDEF